MPSQPLSKRVQFEGMEVAYVVGALTQSLKLVDRAQDIDIIGNLLDRSIGALAGPLDEDVANEVARVRRSKGLPA